MMFNKTILLVLFLQTICLSFGQTGEFKYQYENQQARAGYFSFNCPQDSTLNFKAEATAGYLGSANNPYMQSTINVGPIPNGTWTISAIKNKDKIILRLTPEEDVSITYRSGFLIHGKSDNKTALESSTGCIIIDKAYRKILMKAFQYYGPIKISVTNFTTSDPKFKG